MTEFTHIRDDHPYDVKVPEKLTDPKASEKIVRALKKWSKRNVRED